MFFMLIGMSERLIITAFATVKLQLDKTCLNFFWEGGEITHATPSCATTGKNIASIQIYLINRTSLSVVLGS